MRLVTLEGAGKDIVVEMVNGLKLGIFALDIDSWIIKL